MQNSRALRQSALRPDKRPTALRRSQQSPACASCLDAELALNLLERHPFGFGYHRSHPNELQRHHPAEEEEDVTRCEGADERGKERRQERGENPMRRAAERLARRPVLVREYLGDQNPDHRALTDGVRRDESKNAGGHDRVVMREERPGAESQRRDISVGANRQQRAAPEAVDQPEADEGEDEIGDADADGLEQRRARAESSHLEYARGEVENRVNSGHLIEKR